MVFMGQVFLGATFSVASFLSATSDFLAYGSKRLDQHPILCRRDLPARARLILAANMNAEVQNSQRLRIAALLAELPLPKGVNRAGSYHQRRGDDEYGRIEDVVR